MQSELWNVRISSDPGILALDHNIHVLSDVVLHPMKLDRNRHTDIHRVGRAHHELESPRKPSQKEGKPINNGIYKVISRV